MLWDDAPHDWRRLAAHEAGHAVIAEFLAWRVEAIFITPGIGGEVRTVDVAPAPWIEIAVGAAGHAAEAALCGGLHDLSYSDRRRVADAFEGAGADSFACLDVEGQIALLVATSPRLRWRIVAVARALVEAGGRLNRQEFLRIAGHHSRLRNEVRRACRQIVREALQDSMDGD